ncbi:MAG: hypothetical protein N3G22_05090 [Candidatus Micrarchaeota archaeon]|nr:hypothetical protein [Candidatus Micrarchaeota archaeon]
MAFGTIRTRDLSVQNPHRVRKIVVVGTDYECAKAKMASPFIYRFRPRVELVYIKTTSNGKQLEEKEISPLLQKELKGKNKKTIVISDIGERPRVYPFEILAENVKAFSNGAAFALLTDKSEFVGTRDLAERAVQERNIRPPSILEKVDYIFHNSGDLTVYSAIIQLHEDMINHAIKPDRSILVVEDKPNYFTAFLNTLFNITQHRTRVLLAQNYEQAMKIIDKCKKKLIGAIIDVQFPKDGALTSKAWPEILERIKKHDKKIPVIVQSVDRGFVNEAAKEKAVFALWKNDPAFLAELRRIINDFFGFGDFIFRLPNGREIGRAKTLKELYVMLRKISDESLIYHASNDHFSQWLWLHGYKKLALQFKPVFFEDPAILRKKLCGMIEPYVRRYFEPNIFA